jgi:hypothetical protein
MLKRHWKAKEKGVRQQGGEQKSGAHGGHQAKYSVEHRLEHSKKDDKKLFITWSISDQG